MIEKINVSVSVRRVARRGHRATVRFIVSRRRTTKLRVTRNRDRAGGEYFDFKKENINYPVRVISSSNMGGDRTMLRFSRCAKLHRQLLSHTGGPTGPRAHGWSSARCRAFKARSRVQRHGFRPRGFVVTVIGPVRINQIYRVYPPDR